MINSLLNQDFYKFSMGQIALHQFPSTIVRYEFKCRNESTWTNSKVAKLRYEIGKFCRLKFTEDELSYLSNIKFFKQSYIDFLRLYQPNLNHVSVNLVDGELKITVEGPWFLTIYFEVPILAIVNEVYFKNKCNNSMAYSEQQSFLNSGRERLNKKIALTNEVGFPFADFGTRRRFSGKWQDEVIETLSNNAVSFVGTSNVYLAKKYDVKPVGTQAHEIFMIHQAIYPLRDFQKYTLENWVKEYKGNLGIALTDTINTDTFLNDFDLHFASVYSGVRHDSGSAFDWAEKMIAHYEKLGIDPKSKSLVFSDSLNFEKCAKLYEMYRDRAKISFGIGTNLVNDFDGIIPLQIVIKVVECNNNPVAKISNNPGKGMCSDLEYLRYLKKVFNIS